MENTEGKFEKYLEIKQCTSKQSISQERNHRNIRKLHKLNENKETKYQNLWDTTKTTHKEKIVIGKADIGREELKQKN